MSTVKVDRYPVYKNSGVEWIEDIPVHWEVKKFKRVFYEIKKRSNPELNCGSISFGKVIYKDDEKIPESTKRSYQVVLKGDFLVNPLNLNYDLISLRIALSEIDAVVSSGYIVLSNLVKIDRGYYKYFLHRFDVAFMKLLGSGVRQTLNYNDIANCDLIFPPLPEQTAIASFLDRKTTQIDKAISIKERQIELLKERRQILIHQAVTRGLDPNVKMKDSGVEWIGEIPEHWEVKRLKNICEMLVSNVDKHTKPIEHPVKLCNYVDVYKNDFITSAIEFMQATATIDEIGRFKIKINDVIITKDSEDWLDIGAPALVKYEEENLICGYHLAILRPLKKIHGAFFHRSLLSPYIRTQFSVKANGVTRYGISHGAILGTYIIVPPLEEQKQISIFIEIGIQKIATSIACKVKEIEKLKEYKATLINSAVTGKIKVG